MTSNNEYYQQILNVLSGETISTYETTLNLMKKICLAYGCTYSSAQCSNKYLKDFAEASIGTTYSENKLNIEYLHDIALNFYPLTDAGTENYYLGIIADYITVTPKLHTDLTIDVPLVLVYSDEFDITGVLTDENDDPVANANIDLLVGNTIVDSATTDSTGTVEFTQAPVSMGNHTFQLVYTGDTEHYSTSSSTVSRVINKETSVLNVSLPLDGANYYDYENIAVTGTLYDNDGDLIEGTSVVKVYNGSTLLETATVSNGSFNISNLSDIAGTLGDYTLIITYEGNDYYTASSVTRTIHIVEEILYDDLTLTITKSILSYYDTEYADLTAQLTYEGSDVAISGVAIDFYVDGVLKDTINTNNSGRSVYRYNSTGAGDVTIVAKIGTFSSETYELQDIAYFNDGSSVGSLEVGSNVSCTSNGDYITITTSTSGEKDVKLPVTLTGDWEFETTLAETLPTGSQLTFKVGTGQQWGAFNADNSVRVNLGSSQSFTKPVSKDMTMKVIYQSGTMTVYWNNEQLASKSVTVTGKIGYYTNSGRYQYIKNIKLKAL